MNYFNTALDHILTREEARECIERELMAIAAGYSGSLEDIVSYIRYDMLNEPDAAELLLHMSKEFGFVENKEP